MLAHEVFARAPYFALEPLLLALHPCLLGVAAGGKYRPIGMREANPQVLQRWRHKAAGTETSAAALIMGWKGEKRGYFSSPSFTHRGQE